MSRIPVPRRDGSTLLEILVVVVVLGLVVVALAGGSIVRQARRSAVVGAIAAVQDLEQRTRLAAIGRGGAFQVSWRELRGRAGADDWLLVPAEGLQVSVLVEGRPVGQVVYDDRGRSLDATVLLRRDSDQARFRIQGLTGAWTLLDATGALARDGVAR